jgi:hypothetical protein
MRKYCLIHSIFAVLMTSLLSSISFAATSTSSAVSAEQLSAQTQALEKQMHALEAQLSQLKRQQASLLHQTPTSKTSQKKATTNNSSKPATVTTSSHKQDKKVFRNNPQGTPGSQVESAAHAQKWLDIRGTTVVTSPYFGPQPQFDGSEMLVNTSSVNKDLVLLQMRQKIDNQLTDADMQPEKYSVIALSGELEGSANYTGAYTNSHSSDLNLTAAEIDVAALAYPWLLGYLTVEYNDGALPDTTSGNGRRENNSNLELGQGFFTVGNLNRSPLYLSIGQLYAPFGQYTSYMTSDSLPKILGRSKVRAAVVGYNDPSNKGLYGSLYTFSGDSRTTENRNIDEGGFNVGYRYRAGPIKATASTSFITNIADSAGMQNNGVDDANQFQGFGASSSTEQIQRRVPGLDIQGNISYGAYTWIAEYTGAVRHFDETDLSFNGHGAKPQAIHTEGVYNFAFYERPASLAIGYDRSWQALGLNLPRSRVSSTVSYSVWRNTLVSFEFLHDINYSNDTAGGIIDGNQSDEVLLTPAGSNSNAFTLTLDYFF